MASFFFLFHVGFSTCRTEVSVITLGDQWWDPHGQSHCSPVPLAAGLASWAFPEVCKNRIHPFLSHNKKLSLSPQITNTGSISLSAMGNLVCAVTLLTVNKEVAHWCSVYLLKYCYFKNTLLSSKCCPLLSNLSELCFLMTILEICKSFLRTWKSFAPLSSWVTVLQPVWGSIFQMVTYSCKQTGVHSVGETETTSKKEGIHLSGKSRFKTLMWSRQKNKPTFVLSRFTHVLWPVGYAKFCSVLTRKSFLKLNFCWNWCISGKRKKAFPFQLTNIFTKRFWHSSHGKQIFLLLSSSATFMRSTFCV